MPMNAGRFLEVVSQSHVQAVANGGPDGRPCHSAITHVVTGLSATVVWKTATVRAWVTVTTLWTAAAFVLGDDRIGGQDQLGACPVTFIPSPKAGTWSLDLV